MNIQNLKIIYLNLRKRMKWINTLKTAKNLKIEVFLRVVLVIARKTNLALTSFLLLETTIRLITINNSISYLLEINKLIRSVMKKTRRRERQNRTQIQKSLSLLTLSIINITLRKEIIMKISIFQVAITFISLTSRTELGTLLAMEATTSQTNDVFSNYLIFIIC